MKKMVIPLVIAESVICAALIAIVVQMRRNKEDNDDMIHHVESDISDTNLSNTYEHRDSNDSIKRTTTIPPTETRRIGLVSTVATEDDLDVVIKSTLMLDKRLQSLEGRFDNLCKHIWDD